MGLDDKIKLLVQRYPKLSGISDEILEAYRILEECYKNGNKVLVAGNGGSAADAQHIVGELMKGFVKKRRLSENEQDKLREIDPEIGGYIADKLQGALPTIALNGMVSLETAYMNDIEGEVCIAQQVNGYGRVGDVLLAISTSGNSKNIIYASVLAKAKGMKVILLSGRDGGKLKKFSDVSIIVPEVETYKIQELHLPIYHTLCLMLEEYFFND